jgi:hypothetical protein
MDTACYVWIGQKLHDSKFNHSPSEDYVNYTAPCCTHSGHYERDNETWFIEMRIIWEVRDGTTANGALWFRNMQRYQHRKTQLSDTNLSLYGKMGSAFFYGATAPSGPAPQYYRGFTITLRHTTLGRTPLDEWSARRRDLYLTTHHTHKRHTSMPKVGFETAIPAGERPQTYALERAANGDRHLLLYEFKFFLYQILSKSTSHQPWHSTCCLATSWLAVKSRQRFRSVRAMKVYEEMEIHLHPFLTSTLPGNELWVSRPDLL